MESHKILLRFYTVFALEARADGGYKKVGAGFDYRLESHV